MLERAKAEGQCKAGIQKLQISIGALFSTADPQIRAEHDLILNRAKGDANKAWQMCEGQLTDAKRRGERVDTAKADMMRKLLLGKQEQGDMFGEPAPEKPKPLRKQIVDRPVQQSLEGLDDGMLFSTVDKSPDNTFIGKRFSDIANQIKPDPEPNNLLIMSGSESKKTKHAAYIYSNMPNDVIAFDGEKVLIKNPEKGKVSERFKHLTSYGDKKTIDNQKVKWLPLIPDTLKFGHVKLRDKTTGNYVYMRNYNGTLHAVVTQPTGNKNESIAYDSLLITQFPDHDTSRRNGFKVIRERNTQRVFQQTSEADLSDTNGAKPSRQDNSTIPQSAADVKPRFSTASDKDYIAAFERGDKRTDDVRYSVIGERGSELPQLVRDMERQGKSKRAIWKNTGWWKGHDGKWRFEIDDLKMKFTGKLIDGTHEVQSKGKLSELIEHPSLFEAYPQLGEVELWMDLDASKKTKGIFRDSPFPIIEYQGSFKNALNVIAHEIQHAIQKTEGFSRGADESDTNELSKRIKQNIIKATQSDDDKLTPLNARAQKRLKHLQKLKEGSGYLSKNEDAYFLAGGEVEARLVEKRLDLPPAQRKAIPPWVTEAKMLREEGLLDKRQKPEDVVLFSTTEDNESIRKFLEGEPVVRLTGEEFQKTEESLVKRVSRWFKEKYNNVVNSPEIGDVILNRRGVQSSIAHGLGRNKVIAFAAVPDIISKGRVLSVINNYQGKKLDRILIAAPIRISDTDYVGIATVDRSKTNNKFYFHEVAITENLQKSLKTGASPIRQSTSDSGDIQSILQNIFRVNPAGTRYSTTDTTPQPVPLPELARMTVDMLGSHPNIRRKLNALGKFRHTQTVGDIQLRADIFIGPDIHHAYSPQKPTMAQIKEAQKILAEDHGVSVDDLVTKTARQKSGYVTTTYRRDHDYAGHILAHEIGHADHWLPDKNMDRGNILDRFTCTRSASYDPIELIKHS